MPTKREYVRDRAGKFSGSGSGLSSRLGTIQAPSKRQRVKSWAQVHAKAVRAGKASSYKR